MNGLITPFTLSVAAQTTQGAEVKLQRSVQLVAIPVFQFGIFSNTDLAFFNGPPFDFGGRVHTNGNLWLAADNGPLYIRDNDNRRRPGDSHQSGKWISDDCRWMLTAASSPIALAPFLYSPPIIPLRQAPMRNGARWVWVKAVCSATNSYQNLSGNPNNAGPTAWQNVTPLYFGMIQNGVQPLNLIATALGGLPTPAALIHRPIHGEQLANPAQFNQRYFSNTQASLRILLDDYGPGGVAGVAGACNTSPMMALDTVSTGTPPVDLATLAYDSAIPFNYAAGKPTSRAMVHRRLSPAAFPGSGRGRQL